MNQTAWKLVLVSLAVLVAGTIAVIQYRECRAYGMSVLLCSRYLVR